MKVQGIVKKFVTSLQSHPPPRRGAGDLRKLKSTSKEVGRGGGGGWRGGGERGGRAKT